MRLILAALLALCLLACQSPAYDVRYPSVAAEALAVRQIILDYDGDGEMDSACTAFQIAPHSWVTAKHCTEDDPTITFADGQGALTPVKCHATADVCLLASFNAREAGTLPLGTRPDFGEPVHYIGYPYYGEFHYGVYDGRWGKCYENFHIDPEGGAVEIGEECEFSAFVDGGASGSPLIDADGFVVGVVVSSFRSRPYAYAVPVDAIRDLL